MSFLGFWVQRLPNKAHGVGTIFERAGLLLNNVLPALLPPAALTTGVLREGSRISL